MGGKKTVENSRRFEKDRRDKLNVAFGELCKLLPDHDPSVNLSKMEILRKAAEYIKHLQLQNDEIMKLGEDSALKSESEKLKKRVANLLFKTKELVDALRCAGVPIPTSKRKKKKSKNVVGDKAPINQNSTSGDIEKEAKTSKEEATTIKKVKCGCMNQSPEKKPLKESNSTVTTAPTIPTIVSVGNVIAVTCVSSNSIPPWTNHTKLLTVTPTSLVKPSVVTSRVQSIPVVKRLLPSCKNSNNNSIITTIPKSNSCNKNSPIARSVINSLPIAPSTIQTIPIIGNNLLPTKIVKEVTPTLINKKTVNLVTTTSSSSSTTQTIVNSTRLISLSQSNIVSAPVVPPSVQTVPVLEKNILSNLGPGTLILADGRIMNVPPMVPQILVKPQPTVILMPSTKKKEKIIVPKKRDVTKTTFANKAPIPAIKTFRLESCPKVRPKKRPKAFLKKSETTKIPEKESDPRYAGKKRKIDNACHSITEEINDDKSKNMDSSKQVENKDIDSILVDEIGKDISNNEVVTLSSLTSGEVLNQEVDHQVGMASGMPEASSTMKSSEIINNCSPLTAPSSSILAITDSSYTSTRMSNPNPEITKLCDSIVVSIATTETLDSFPNSSIPPALSNINETNTKVTFKDVDLNKNTVEDQNSSFESNNDVIITDSEIELSSFNTDSSQALLAIASSEENIKTSATDDVSVNSLPSETLPTCKQSDHSTSLEIRTTSAKNDLANSESLTHCSIMSTSCSETNPVYSVSLIATSSLPEVIPGTSQSPLLGTNNETTIGNKSVAAYSCQPQQMFYTGIDFNQENRSESNCFQQGERLNSHLSEKCEVHPATKPSNSTAENEVNTYTGSSFQAQNQPSKTGTELSNSAGSSFKPAVSSPLTNNKEMSNQEISITSTHNDLPDLGSNALAESSSIFPRIKEVTGSTSLSGQEKINYSHTNTFPVENHIVTSNSGNSSLNMLQNKNQLLPIANNSFHQQQDNVSQLVHAQVSHSTLKSSQPIDPFCTNSYRQDALVYSQSNDLMVYSKANEPFSNHPTYGLPGSLLGDKGSSLGYPNLVNKSVSLHSEKLPSSNAVPTMSMNPTMSSSNSMYSAYCSTNFYPTTTVTYSQNNYMTKSANKSTSTLSDNISKKIIPYGGYCHTTPSMSASNKHFCSENMSFHHNSLAKPNWEKTNNNKAYYSTSSNNLPENKSDKDKNSSFQYDKIAGIEKHNESQIHGQMMYLGFQNETVTSNAGGFLQNFPSTSSVLQTSCSFNNVSSSHSVQNSTAPLKPINHHENSLNFNATLIGRNSLDKSCSSSQPTNIDKGRTVSNIDEETRNAALCLPSFQPSERMVFASCPESLKGLQNNNSFDGNSLVKTKKTTESNCLSRTNFITEQKTLGVEPQKPVTSSNNSVQVKSGHNVYNSISTSFIETNSKINAPSSNNITVDVMGKVNEVQISYSQDKDVSKTNRFTENVSCKPTDSAKTNSLYSTNVIGKENVSQITSNVSPETTKNMNGESERNSKTNVYNNYVPKPSANGKNILNSNAEINNTTHKMNDSIGNMSTHYKGYIGDSTNSEKQLQDNHKSISSSTQKSVSTEMNPDEFQTFNYNNSTYQKLLQTQNSSFASSSSKITSTSVRAGSFANYDNVNFGSLSNHYSNNSIAARNGSVCSNQNTNLPLQLLPPTSGSSQVIPHPNNKTAMVSVMSHSLAQTETFNPKICQPPIDSTTFKGDMNIDYLKSKDMERNTFIPIIDDVRLTSDFSSDLFSSLQVPTGGQHSESISPTAAFLLAFPLVSTSRNIENLPDNENHDNQTSTPTTILQIGNIEPPNTELFHSIEFQKNNKGNGHYEMNNDFIHVNDIHAKQNTSYNKTCEKRKDVFPDFNKDQRAVEPKPKPKSSSAATISYSTQSYNYSHFSCNDYQQYCDKEGSQWHQEFSKDQKKSCEKKKDKGVQKGRIFQNYQEYYNYKDGKRKQQNRISVNWMTTPENKEHAEPYQPKDPEITNSYPSHSSQPVFNSIPIDFPTESFSDFGNTKKANNYSWSPSKTLLPALDSHLMIPSTLPTLVGDLALGTSTPSESYKPFEPQKVQSTHGLIVKKPSEKIEENKNRTDFPKTQVNFSSVSELVDPKSKKQKTTDRSYRRQEKSSKQRGNFNCLKRKDDHCMYYEERNNYASNQNQNQCIEKRHAYKGGSYSAESLIGAQQSEVDFSTNINYQQNPNYFQSDFSTHIDSGQQYGYFQQTHFSGFSHEEYQDFGFSTNQRNLDQTRPKVTVRKDDNYQGSSLQTQVYPPYSKSTHYNLPSSQINTNTTTTLTNFNLSTIFPEMNDQRVVSSGQTSQQMNTSFPSSQTYRSHLQQ